MGDAEGMFSVWAFSVAFANPVLTKHVVPQLCDDRIGRVEQKAKFFCFVNKNIAVEHDIIEGATLKTA